MNKRIITPFIALVGALLVSCHSGITEISATGKPYEIVVVAPRTIWNSAAGDTLRHFFEQDVEWLNQPEPLYNLLPVTPQTVTDPTLRHRNIITLSVGEQYKQSDLTATFDKNSKGQLYIDIVSPSIDSLANFVAQNEGLLISVFDKAERDRFIIRGERFRDVTIGEKIKEKFGFEMNIPKGYRIRDNQPDFLWISYEMPLASQGLAIYSFDPMDEMTTLEILYQRDLAVAKIPGPSEGSYMMTETLFMPESKSVLINGVRWAETRGFWKVMNDFMGGPFVNYTTYDPATKRMVGIDLYVNAPDAKDGKRNYIRQLESLVLSVHLTK